MADEPYLKIADRCDRCGAQAFAAATIDGTDLLFCGHHFAEHETELRKVATKVVDERARINYRPSQSATV